MVTVGQVDLDSDDAGGEFTLFKGKKVCKATAVRCAYLVLFACDRVNWLPEEKKSYSGQLLTAPDRSKKE